MVAGGMDLGLIMVMIGWSELLKKQGGDRFNYYRLSFSNMSKNVFWGIISALIVCQFLVCVCVCVCVCGRNFCDQILESAAESP